ncbi:MAG: glycosyltransferase family 4 protein [Nitrososphaeria archaeon]
MADFRVLHVVQTPLDFVGGPATYVRELSRYLAEYGVEVGIVSPSPLKYTEEMEALNNNYGVKTYYVNLKVFRSLLRAPWVFSVRAHKLISRIVKYYDVVNVHVESTLLQQLTGTFNSARLVSTVHGIYPYEDIEVIKHDPLNIYRIFRLMFISPQHYITLKNLVSNSECVVPVAGFLAKKIRAMFDVKEEKLVVIPNSVDTDFFKPIKRDLALKVVNDFLRRKGFIQISESAEVILFLSRIDPRKGLHILLRSLKNLNYKPWILLVAGTGQPSYISHVMELASKLNLAEKVCFVGRVPKPLLPYFYSVASVYVLPSMFEGLPTTILEAMACGTPVVASGVSGIPEVIVNNQNGLIINSLSEDLLCRTINLILSDLSLKKELSKEAIKTVKEKFSWEINIQKYLRLFNELSNQ